MGKEFRLRKEEIYDNRASRTNARLIYHADGRESEESSFELECKITKEVDNDLDETIKLQEKLLWGEL